jgi:uncharacterized protein (TIRG00374 family)
MLGKYTKYVFLSASVAALIYFLYKFRNSITLQGFGWSEVVTSIRDGNRPLLLLAIVTIFACYAIRALRWIRFSRALGHAGFWSVYGATLMGFSCVFLLGRAGEPVRPVLISRRESLSMPGMFSVFFLERIFDAAASIVLACVGLLLFNQARLQSAQGSHLIVAARSTGIVLFLGLMAVVIFLVYFRLHGGEWLSRRLQHPNWRHGFRARLAALLEGFSDGLQGIRTWSDLGALMGYSIVHWILVVCVWLLVERGIGGGLQSLSLNDTILVLAFTLVGSAIQLPVAGGGAQAAAFAVLTRVFGIASGPAAAMAIVIWLVSFASCCVVGIPLLFREGLSVKELRQITKKEERASEADLLAEAERAAHVEDTSR